MILGGLRTFKLGIKSLWLHKLRSALTMLGLLFGVCSVIAMLAVGEGASYAALEQIKAMGSTNLMARSQRPPETEASASADEWQALAYGLRYSDAARIRAMFPHAEHVVSVRETEHSLRVGEKWASSVVVGTTPEYLEVMGIELREGRWLTHLDVERSDNVAVLGASATKTLFPIKSPLDQEVQAGRVRFTVVGTLEELGREASPGGVPLDECVFVPLTTSRARFGDSIHKEAQGTEERTRVELHEIKIKMRDTASVLPAAMLLGGLLDIGARAQDDVKLIVPLELLRQREQTARIFNIVLGSIAVISLIVGGIGIMNVMLATVTERTREIGIRRALGAKRVHIVYQFLVETVVLSGAGGALGVAFGLLIPALITALSNAATLVRVEHVVLSFGISVGVGVAFGIYPACRAAVMDPVVALRHE